MDIASAKAIVLRFFDETWNRKRVDEIDEYISTENINKGPSAEGIFGPDHFRQMMKNWHTAFPDFQYRVEAMVAENDLVAVRTTFTGTHMGDFRFGSDILPPSGKSLRVMEMFFFRVVNGKIVETWAGWDRLRVYEQLGVQPAI